MKINYRVASALAATLAMAAGNFSTAHGSGFGIFTQGASSLGQGNAVTAHADDPSALFYNPALISKLPGTQLQVGTTAITTFRDFRNFAGVETDAKTTVFFPSTVYLTHRINEKFSAGLGIFNPFGLGSKWGTTWEGRYITSESKLTTFNINPAISYRITPSLSVAAGVDVILADAELEKMLPGVTSDVRQKFEGDGMGVGYNVAVAWDITKALSVGVSYRSEVEVELEGDSSVSQTLGLYEALNSPGETEIDLPQQLTAGIAYRVSEPLVVEAGLRWEGWTSFKELRIDLASGSAPTSRRDWDDSLGCNFGLKYQVTPNVALLGGYIFGANPIPDHTFEPGIPDADTHIFTVGTDLDFGNFSLALSYAYQRLVGRTKNNEIDNTLDPLFPDPLPKANGRYHTDAHLVGLSVGYRF